MGVVRVAAALGLLIVACGGDDETDPVIVPPNGCAPGEWRNDDGVCIPAGLPSDMPCPPGEEQRADGRCVVAGVPPDGCAEGFVHDGDRGCTPILPDDCALGFMAVPGETLCREVAPCASGTWGDIPIEPNSEHVDASYAGTDSDGTALKPWTRIQDAIDAAAPDAIVAIAAGTYDEDLSVIGKAVRLWGVCPSLVVVRGTSAAIGAIYVRTGAAGTEIHDLAVHAERVGILLSGSEDVRLDRLWVHHSQRGLDIEGALGPTAVQVRDSLLEQNFDIGMFVQAADAIVEASVIRDTRVDWQSLFGRGVSVQPDAAGTPASLVVRNALLERNHDHGIFVGGAQATIEGSVIRDTLPDAEDYGRGVGAEREPISNSAATLTLRGSVVADNRDLGISVFGSTATIDATVVRGTLSNIMGRAGRGIDVEVDPRTAVPSKLDLHASLVEQNHEIGIFVAGSEAAVSATVVRDTQPDSVWGGAGLVAQREREMRATLSLGSSLLERNIETGLLVAGSDASVDATVVRNNLPDAQGVFGRGVNAQEDNSGVGSTLTLERSRIETNVEAAVSIIGSAATLHACDLADTVPNPLALFGHGAMVVTDTAPANVTITATRVERSALAAVAVWGAEVGIGGSVFRCQAFDFNSESHQGRQALLHDLGGNACGCPEPVAGCKAVSAGLEPPTTVEPAR